MTSNIRVIFKRHKEKSGDVLIYMEMSEQMFNNNRKRGAVFMKPPLFF